MSTKLINKHNVCVLVSDERVASLLKSGFTRAPDSCKLGKCVQEDLNSLSKKELVDLAAQHDIELPEKVLKSDIIDALKQRRISSA